ncbi:M23 family metallopeptidase [Bifidobacterium simiarum]|uniref:M23ase beta-sheet core domain-containing protein n=1 Tax=Bifidobacterium simiarum TaxID=2045441 RepID=A0A2M9HHK7_9BIFI|nr:M23 family metallopeptidase [Bifidobacterium simiarum]PJM76279.1 hypothetical protein CSQ87_01855 [Bifidobacterium simiarum]
MTPWQYERHQYRQRLRLRQYLERRLSDRRRGLSRRICLSLLLTIMLLTGMVVWTTIESPAVSAATGGGESCPTAFRWPVRTSGHADPPLGKSFDNPAKPWLPGHRGIDILAPSGTTLIAPDTATIAFAGQVGGKSVVSLRHGNGLTTTYEPAEAGAPVGTAVNRGMPFAQTAGRSDHCAGTCVHWGVKRANGTYVDPMHMVHRQRIALKPM